MGRRSCPPRRYGGRSSPVGRLPVRTGQRRQGQLMKVEATRPWRRPPDPTLKHATTVLLPIRFTACLSDQSAECSFSLNTMEDNQSNVPQAPALPKQSYPVHPPHFEHSTNTDSIFGSGPSSPLTEAAGPGASGFRASIEYYLYSSEKKHIFMLVISVIFGVPYFLMNRGY